MKRLIFILLVLLGCTRNESPHFEKVDPNYFARFNPEEGDFIDTLIRNEKFEFYHYSDAYAWEGSSYYLMKKNNEIFILEPSSDIGNGFTELKVINDSTLVFYEQFGLRPFGDFWIVKKDDSQNGSHLYTDPGYVSNTERYDLKYEDGKLIAIGNIEVNLDSSLIKTYKEKLYKLNINKLKEISNYKHLIYKSTDLNDMAGLDPGIYYFSYPGRHITDTLILK